MANNPAEALDALFSELSSLGAEALADDIRRAIARGTLGQVEVRPRKFEVTPQPLSAEAAYHLAAQMLLAAVEPVLMHADLRVELAPKDHGRTDLIQHVNLVWKRDLIEGSPAEPRPDAEAVLPVLADDAVNELRARAGALATLLDEFEREEM